MIITLRPKSTKSLLEVGFAAALWSAGVMMSNTPDIVLKVVAIVVPLIIPGAFVALIPLTRITLYDDGQIRWVIAGHERLRISASDIVRYDDGFLFAAVAHGLGAGKAFIITYRKDGKEKELRFSSKLYDKADVERLKKFIDSHRNG